MKLICLLFKSAIIVVQGAPLPLASTSPQTDRRFPPVLRPFVWRHAVEGKLVKKINKIITINLSKYICGEFRVIKVILSYII